MDILRELLEAGLREGVYPSAVLGVGRGETVLYRRAVGRLWLPDGPAADLDTRYDMASLTKIFGATMLALKALEAGKLTLWDELSRFLPAPADKSAITVRQLLTHTAGFAPHFRLDERGIAPEEAMAAILNHPLAAQPGERMLYTCMGYIILGFLLERVYGAPLGELVEGLVLRPLGLDHTGYRPAGDNIAATETGTPLGVVHDENARFLGGVSANAGIFSDIGDCLRFAGMLARMGAGYLSPATMRRALINYTPGMEQHRGLGFQLQGSEYCFMGDLFPEGSFGHTGFTGTAIAVDPGSGLHVTLLTNAVHPRRGNDKLYRFRRALMNAAYAQYDR